MPKPSLRTVAIVLIALALLTEGALRLYGFGRGIRYRPQPELGWEMVPSQQAFNIRGRTHVRVNSQGFRGPEIPAPGPGPRARILFLGDGSTLGNQLPEAQTFPFLVRDQLAAAWPAKTVDVAVGAVSSYQLEQHAALLRSRGVALAPTAVVVGFCWNDWAVSLMRGPHLGPPAYDEYTGLGKPWQRTAWYDFATRLDKVRRRWLQSRAIARGEQLPAAATDVPAWEHVEAMLDSIAATSQSLGARVVLLVVPSLMNRQDAASFASRKALLRAWAGRRGAGFADPEAAFDTAEAAGQSLFLDAFHLAAPAQPLVAACLVEALNASTPEAQP